MMPLFTESLVRAALATPSRKRRLLPNANTDRRAHLAMRLANGVEIDAASGCWNWCRARNQHGYGSLTIGRRTVGAHRVALELAGIVIPSGASVLHHCDNRACINPAHLYVGTQTDNMRDCSRRGRISVRHGTANHAAKLTEPDVLEIRRRLASGEGQTKIAKAFGVSQVAISCIALRKTWKSLAGFCSEAKP